MTILKQKTIIYIKIEKMNKKLITNKIVYQYYCKCILKNIITKNLKNKLLMNN